MKTWPKLYYTNNSGKLYEWGIWVDGSEIYTKYGGVGDSKQVAIKCATPKNVGKSNETTPQEQAELEAEAMWVFKKERRYSENEEDSSIVERLRPMLAKKLGELPDKVFPVAVQPKLDGIRCLIKIDNGNIEMVSRSGKPIVTCGHISQQIQAMKLPSMVIDGELYNHDITFQAITKLVKKYYPGKSEDINFVYYDSYTETTKDLPWEERHTFSQTSSNVHKLAHMNARDEEGIKAAHRWNIKSGYEGSIIRISRGIKKLDYRTGARSSALLKLKDFLDDEYPVVGYTEGIGKFTGCIIYECKTPEGISFNVVPRGTMEERKYWFKNARRFIGNQLTVRYFATTEDGVPRFPIGIGIRWDKE